MSPYVTERDDQGDDVLVYPEGAPVRLPHGYFTREVELAVENMEAGADRREMPISRNVLHTAVQVLRACRIPAWGALVLALVSCAPDPRIVVSSDFTPDEMASIRRAAAKWNTVLVRPMNIDPSGPWHVVKDTPPDRWTKGFVGQTFYAEKLIFIEPGLSPDAFYKTVLHEFGHLNGLHHVQGQSVMAPSASSTEFSEEDMEECRTVGACGLSQIDYAKCRLQGACQ
jgi:hypothetical protein